ncbi:hypothetical protein PSJ8397_02053 [Pseudooctadecabacter jejudonensis]|uniref:LysR substrate binding domain protein n=1 Tax=Pseudooctadecabacter jejudonensis TaxID=1391910 RepID=A0A1Y5SHN9_9RHOB|nr:hypothetical protein PSJ8397_02053 [Pseudooctadecabacter jejudonensis]
MIRRQFTFKQLKGLGVGLLPRSLVSEDIKAGRLAALDADRIARPLSFYARYNANRALLQRPAKSQQAFGQPNLGINQIYQGPNIN